VPKFDLKKVNNTYIYIVFFFLKMQDRIKDLYEIDGVWNSSFPKKELTDGCPLNKDLEAEMQEISMDIDDTPAGLQAFNEQVDIVRNQTNAIKLQIEKLSCGYRCVLLETADSSEQEELNKQLENEIENLIRLASQELKAQSVNIRESLDNSKWKSNVHSLVTIQFMEVLSSYRSMQSQHRDKIKERIRERVLVVKPEATTEEVESIVESGKMNVFAQEISNQNLIQAKDALFYVEKKDMKN